MAGDWIKMRCDLASDPAVIQIAATLEVDEDLIVGKLHRLWSWADSQTIDGNARVTLACAKRYVDRLTGITGFAEAMQECGWLRLEETRLVFPDFERHNGQTGKRRALTSSRAAEFRSRKRNATDVTKCAPREEKRREEDSSKEESIATPVGSGILFPLSTGKVWELPTRRLAEYEATYGGLFDVRRELEKARLWLADSKSRRSRTGPDTQKRLTLWMSRTCDRCAKTVPGSPVAAVPAGDVVFNAETGEIVKPLR
jgi:hypothetical protein